MTEFSEAEVADALEHAERTPCEHLEALLTEILVDARFMLSERQFPPVKNESMRRRLEIAASNARYAIDLVRDLEFERT